MSLAVREAGGANANSLLPVFYVVGILATFCGGLWALLRWYKDQKKEWSQEAKAAAEQKAVLRENTEAGNRNTKALETLAAEFRRFVDESRQRADATERRLDRHEGRIDRLDRNSFRFSRHPIRPDDEGDD